MHQIPGKYGLDSLKKNKMADLITKSAWHSIFYLLQRYGEIYKKSITGMCSLWQLADERLIDFEVWYLIVSIPDLCTITYFCQLVFSYFHFAYKLTSKFPTPWPCLCRQKITSD